MDTGGPVSLGYQIVKMGRLNKKGNEIYDLEIDPKEVCYVTEIFEKTVKEGYGSYRIASYLNKLGVRTHNGTKFQSNTIIRILRNKLYCGYIVSGEAVSPQMKELQIVSKELFEQAQYILDQRAKKNDDKRQIAMTTKSKTLLSGIMFCAHCGGRLTSSLYHDTYTRTDGTVRTAEYLRYLCYHKSRRLCKCTGQSTYAAEKVDEAVCSVIRDMFHRIKGAPEEEVLQKNFKKEMASCKAKQTKINLELKKNKNQLEKLEDEIAKTLTGESMYSPEQLTKAIKLVEEKISEANLQMEQLSNEIEGKKSSMEMIKPAYVRFTNWADEFDYCSLERKKMIISQLVSRIELGKGYKINVELNMDYEQFCEGLETVTEDSRVLA